MLRRVSKRYLKGKSVQGTKSHKATSISSPDETLLLVSGCGMGFNHTSILPTFSDALRIMSWNCHLNDQWSCFRWKATLIAEPEADQSWFEWGPSYSLVFYSGPPIIFKGFNDLSHRVVSGHEMGWSIISFGSVKLSCGSTVRWTTFTLGVKLGTRSFNSGKVGLTGSVRRKPRFLMKKAESHNFLMRLLLFPFSFLFLFMGVYGFMGKRRIDTIVGDDAELRSDIDKLVQESRNQFNMGNPETGRYIALLIDELVARKENDTETVEKIKARLEIHDADADRYRLFGTFKSERPFWAKDGSYTPMHSKKEELSPAELLINRAKKYQETIEAEENDT